MGVSVEMLKALSSLVSFLERPTLKALSGNPVGTPHSLESFSVSSLNKLLSFYSLSVVREADSSTR